VEKGQVFRNLIQQLITLLLFFFLMGFWWGDEKWFQDKVKELSFFLSVGVMFFLASFGTSLISRPAYIQITQENKHFSRNETTFSITGRKKTQEHERVVDLKVNVARNKSVWGWLASYILKKMDVSILVAPVTNGIILEADNEFVRKDVTATEKGFFINVGEYIESILIKSSEGVHIKGCEYLIIEDLHNPVSNEILHITPTLFSKGKEAPSWLNTLIRFENPSHIVNFKWE
jgi:hypothetical protein